MKKFFLFAAAAVTMAAGCQKIQSLVNPDERPVDDNSPVLVTLGTNVSAAATTKAAVNSVTDLHGATINVFGLKKGATDLTVADNYLLGSVTNAEYAPYAFDLEEEKYNPYTTDKYYGSNNETYNFYGYYVGDARKADRNVTAISATGAAITVPVVIDGQDDILLAETDKDADVAAANAVLDRSRVYSAYSARRKVEPNLVFEHQLSQLTFKLVNGTTLTDDATLSVTDLNVKSESKANLVITNDGECKFTANPDNNSDSVIDFTLPKASEDATELAKFTASENEKSLTQSIMVIPGETQYPMTLTLKQKSGVSGAAEHESTVNLDVELASGEIFKAGYSYEVTVKVYASEAVLLNVSVVDWKTGESITIDQDKDEEVERNDAELYAVPVAEPSEGTIAFEVNVPDDKEAYTIEAALSESQNVTPSTGWQELTDTKANPKYAVFTNYLAGKIYYCHLRYKTTDAGDYTNVVPTVATDYCIAPAFKFKKTYLVENTWTSYENLPESYRNAYGSDINESNWSEKAPADLPWLAAEFTPTEGNVVNVKKDGKVIRIFEGDLWKLDNPIGLVTVSAKELGLESIPDGKYTFVICGVESEEIIVGTSESEENADEQGDQQ